MLQAMGAYAELGLENSSIERLDPKIEQLNQKTRQS